MIRSSRYLMCVYAAVSFGLGMGASYSSKSLAQLEEIVVTARARTESLQDVPATITAFTENQIQNMGVQRAEDFVAMTPGVTLVNTVEAGDTQLSIRGINGARDAETNFALVIDGVLYTNPSAFNREYPDLSQIEVLKGPQGALYGRSAAAGAIIMSTKKPTDAAEGSVKISGAEHGTTTAMATFAGPLGDHSAARVTIDHRKTDGHLTNVYLNDDVVNDYEETGVSARVSFEPNDTTSVDVKLRYSEIDAASIAFNAAFELPFFVPALEGLRGLGFVPEAAAIDVNEFDWVFSPNVDPQNEQETLEFSVKLDKDIGLGTLTAWALYSDQEQFFLADGTSGAFAFYYGKEHCAQSAAARSLFLGDATPMQQPAYNLQAAMVPGVDPFLPPYSPTTCDGYQFQVRNQEDLSFQVQLTSDDDSELRWQVGAYYLNIERTVGVAQLEDDGRSNLPTSLVNELTDALVLDDFTTDVYAFFGSVNYDLSDRTELSFALRYDKEEREVDNGVPSPADGYLSTSINWCPTMFSGGCTLNGEPLTGTPWNPAFINLATGEVSASVDSRKESFDEIQPKISMTYDFSDQTTLFASWGVGFKTGGFNNLGAQQMIELFFVNPDGLPVAPPEVYEKETSSAFELGFRSTMADGDVQLNGALFRTEVDDMQFFEFYPGPFGLLRVVENIDEATLEGFEIDLSWQVSDAIRLDAGYSRIDGEIDKMTVRPYVAGNEVPNAPDHTANIALTLEQEVTGGLNSMVRLEYAYHGDVFYHVVQGSDLDSPRSFDSIIGPEGLPYEVPAMLQLGGLATSYANTKVEGYGLVNLRASLSGESWKATLFARNLMDKEYPAEVILAPEFGGAFVHPSAARVAGVELEYIF